jgi:dynein heavy chain 2
VDCFTVSTSPIKSAIEELIQRLNDSMIYHLKRVISEDIRSIDTFLTTGTTDLSTRPQTHEEIGLAYKRHSELQKEMHSKVPLLESAEEKNKLLRTVAGGGHEQLFQLQLKMDSFVSMMDEHQQKLRDQTEVLKKNLQSRIEGFQEDIDKVAARWKHLKPKDSDLEDEKKCVEALNLVKERDLEVAECLKQAEKLKFVFIIYQKLQTLRLNY